MTPVPVKFGIRLVALAALLVALVARSAAAATVTVPGNYPTIQAAINDVIAGIQPDGTTINVQTGTYHEFLSIANNNKSLTVRAVGGVVVVDAEGLGAPAVGVSFASGQIVFEGLTFRNGTRTAGGGFFVQNSSPSFINCIFENNTGTDGGGGALFTSNATFTGCIIRNNSAAHFGGGIYILQGSHPVFTNCDIVNNASGTGGAGVGNNGAGGGVFSSESSPSFYGSRINANTSKFASGGIHHQGAAGSQSSMMIMEDSEVAGNVSSQFPGEPNPAEGGGVHVEDATATLTRVRVHNNQAGTGGGLNVFRGRFDIVDSVIESNQGTNGIGGGITASSNFASPQMGSVVNLTTSLVRNNTAPTGGGIVTLGDNFSPEPARLSITSSVVDHNTSQSQGGGILANRTVLTMNNSLVINNTVSGGSIQFGGGLLIDAVSAATINATTIAHNTAGELGGGLFIAGAINMSGSNVYDNTAGNRGAGIFVDGSANGLPSGTIQNSRIADNTANVWPGQIAEDACSPVTYPNNLITPTTFFLGCPTIASRAPGTDSSSAPRFQVFLAVPGAVDSGTPATLAWSVARATSVTIPGVGVFGTSTGTADVAPISTTTYSMTATANPNYSTPVNATVTVVLPAQTLTPVYADGDFDGDGKVDVAVFRASEGKWYVRHSSTGALTVFTWGQAGDSAVAGDYDGDGKTDVAVFRPSEGKWYVRNSSTGALSVFTWGQAGDVPVPGDYTGDGKADVAVFRPSEGKWYVRDSSTGALSVFAWGQAGDVVVPGDYGGDGKADVAVFRPSEGKWYVRSSSTGALTVFQWGQAGDTPVPGDYEGDGKADVAVFRASEGKWYIRSSSTGVLTIFQWGQAGDVPVPGDYEGDGLVDVAIFRPPTGDWYVRPSSTPAVLGHFLWGQAGDVPILQRP